MFCCREGTCGARPGQGLSFTAEPGAGGLGSAVLLPGFALHCNLLPRVRSLLLSSDTSVSTFMRTHHATYGGGMPSLEHEAPLEVIRQQPDVVADLLRRVLPRLRLPARVTGALGSADMSQVAPAQYLADTVVVLSDQQTGRPALAGGGEP